MGREYWGDISGKFLFGIQSTDDISNLVKCYPEYEFIWNGCNCLFTNENTVYENCNGYCSDDCQHIYCKNCFTSSQEHRNNILELGDEDEPLYTDAGYIEYNISNTHIDDMEENMKIIANDINPNIIAAFKDVENDERIVDLFNGVYDGVQNIINTTSCKDEERILIARYGIGLQILYILRRQDKCIVHCEV